MIFKKNAGFQKKKPGWEIPPTGHLKKNARQSPKFKSQSPQIHFTSRDSEILSQKRDHSVLEGWHAFYWSQGPERVPQSSSDDPVKKKTKIDTAFHCIPVISSD